MNQLKRLSLTFILIFVLAATAFADETLKPPCAPGQTESPPCSSQSLNDEPVMPGQTNSPPAAPVVTVTDIAETVLWSLLLF